MKDLGDAIKLLQPYIPGPHGGGGGDRSPTPASFGRFPRFSDIQLAPPSAVIRAEDPKLPVEPTLIGPELKLADLQSMVLGDPSGVKGPASNGPGDGGGIGPGHGTGVGPGNGPGGGPCSGDCGFGVATFRGVTGASAPQVIYQVDPEFSDAARKAKHQGVVMIAVIVDTDGRVKDPHVVQALGLGLDERALEAVKQWRFKPGMKDGRAVPVYAQIAVMFRLL